MSRATFLPASTLRTPKTTSAPRLASSAATSMPMPLVAPVTSAVLPRRSNCCTIFALVFCFLPRGASLSLCCQDQRLLVLVLLRELLWGCGFGGGGRGEEGEGVEDSEWRLLKEVSRAPGSGVVRSVLPRPRRVHRTLALLVTSAPLHCARGSRRRSGRADAPKRRGREGALAGPDTSALVGRAVLTGGSSATYAPCSRSEGRAAVERVACPRSRVCV